MSELVAETTDASVLGKRLRNEDGTNNGEQTGPLEDDDDDDVGPMPLPADAAGGGAKKKRKGIQPESNNPHMMLIRLQFQSSRMNACISSISQTKINTTRASCTVTSSIFAL